MQVATARCRANAAHKLVVRSHHRHGRAERQCQPADLPGFGRCRLRLYSSLTSGQIRLGRAAPVTILTPSTARRIVIMIAITVRDANRGTRPRWGLQGMLTPVNNGLKAITRAGLRRAAVLVFRGRRTLRTLWPALLLSLGALPAAAATPAPAAAAEPQEVIADLAARLLFALDRQSPAARRDTDKMFALIDDVLSPHFDAEYTARLALGRHWSAATIDQRHRFAAAFCERLLRTYTAAVAEWTSARFKLVPQPHDPEALQVIVHTQIMNSRGAPVPVDYRLHRTTTDWKIFDVIVEGVSYVHSYRDAIDADVLQNGLDAAIARLQARDATPPPARAQGP